MNFGIFFSPEGPLQPRDYVVVDDLGELAVWLGFDQVFVGVSEALSGELLRCLLFLEDGFDLLAFLIFQFLLNLFDLFLLQFFLFVLEEN